MVVAMTAGTISAFGQSAEGEAILDRFDLYNNCQPMMLLVEELPDGAKEINLTKRRLQTAIEARLRSARLYTNDIEGARTYLYINVNLSGRAFSISVQYKKLLYDPISDFSVPATTWNRGIVGTHGGYAGYIVQLVSELVDDFLVAYLHVNEEDCN